MVKGKHLIIIRLYHYFKMFNIINIIKKVSFDIGIKLSYYIFRQIKIVKYADFIRKETDMVDLQKYWYLIFFMILKEKRYRTWD